MKLRHLIGNMLYVVFHGKHKSYSKLVLPTLFVLLLLFNTLINFNPWITAAINIGFGLTVGSIAAWLTYSSPAWKKATQYE